MAWNQAAFGEAFDPSRVIPRDVRDWQSHQWKVEKAAPSTINQRLVALLCFFTWTGGCGLAQSNPTAEVRGIKLTAHQPRGLSRRSLRRLLRAVHSSDNRRDIAIVEVLADTGIRVGDLIDLRIGDVTLQDGSDSLVVREGKHGSFRAILLTKEARAALSSYLDSHPYQVSQMRRWG